jgi:hypothetical protein
MKLKKQYQHVVPQVYLKQFGFQKNEYGGKWCVSTFNSKTKIWQDRVIKRFLGVNNLYDLTPSSSSMPRMLEEDLHGGVEKKLLSIPKYLEGRSDFTRDMKLDMAETMSNFLCRSVRTLNWIEKLVEKGKYEEFFHVITEENGIFESDDDRLEALEVIRSLEMKDKVNNLMLFYMLHVKIILSNAHMTVYFNNGGFDLFTSDNPVTVLAPGLGVLIDPEMQMFFPLNKDLLIHSYWSSDSLEVKEVTPEPDMMLPMTDHLYEYFNRDLITHYHDEFIISPIEKALLDEEI